MQSSERELWMPAAVIPKICFYKEYSGVGVRPEEGNGDSEGSGGQVL